MEIPIEHMVRPRFWAIGGGIDDRARVEHYIALRDEADLDYRTEGSSTAYLIAEETKTKVLAYAARADLPAFTEQELKCMQGSVENVRDAVRAYFNRAFPLTSVDKTSQ